MRPAGLARMGLLALLWGSNFLWISYSLDGFSPLAITTIRLALGALVLLAVIRIQRLRLPTDRRTWGHLFVAAIVANTLPYWLFAQAEQTTPSSLTGAINATTPLWALVIAYAVRADRTITATRIGGLVLGFAGTLILFAPWSSGGITNGVFLALGASASYGLSYAYMARFLVPKGLPPLVLACGQLIAATVPAAVLTPFGPTAINSPATKAIVALAVLGALGTGAAYVLNYRIITDDGPVIASTVTYLLPIVAIALGVLINDEPVTWTLLVGAIVVLAGVIASRAGPTSPAAVNRRRRVEGPRSYRQA